ncbi:uncharacterized protein C7orf50 homolog isoform X2 [Pogoniulus pusillus]|uniref:uncharacterized protein C7orf50 homolog isoform X2 n=1 Tax=Pogoniulus pusillus TaxID=488313 RepID=UPI0030B92D89
MAHIRNSLLALSQITDSSSELSAVFPRFETGPPGPGAGAPPGAGLTQRPRPTLSASEFNAKPATEEEEELTAEERRKLERKLKKERKKKEKQLLREAGISIKKVEPKKPAASELALAYLTSWSENPEEWKFQKTRQTWLLLHMYDREKVPDKYFTILLDYLQGLQGSARDITVQKAEAFMKDLDGSDTEDPNLLEKCERIRQVLQLLS